MSDKTNTANICTYMFEAEKARDDGKHLVDKAKKIVIGVDKNMPILPGTAQRNILQLNGKVYRIVDGEIMEVTGKSVEYVKKLLKNQGIQKMEKTEKQNEETEK